MIFQVISGRLGINLRFHSILLGNLAKTTLELHKIVFSEKVGRLVFPSGLHQVIGVWTEVPLG